MCLSAVFSLLMKWRTNPARLVDVSWHNAHLTPEGVDDTRAVGPNHAGLGLGCKGLSNLDLIRLRNTLSDADDEANLVLNGLENGISGKGRGHVEHSRVRLGLLHRLQCKYEYQSSSY
jgi:hypothetical protein